MTESAPFRKTPRCSKQAVLTPRQVKTLAGIPVSRRKPFLAAYTARSKASAIKAFCIQCLGYEDISGITACTAEACPLWRFRPYQKRAADGAPPMEA
jgi:hypothetical protein